MKSIEEYLSLPYHFELIPDEDEEARTGWVIAVEELPGCISQGKTPNQAMDNIRDAMAGWLSVAIEDGHEIPEPRPEPSYSGRFVVRLPTGLHAALAIEAEREGVSLNQLVTAVLAGAVRWSGAPETDGSTASYAERTSTRAQCEAKSALDRARRAAERGTQTMDGRPAGTSAHEDHPEIRSLLTDWYALRGKHRRVLKQHGPDHPETIAAGEAQRAKRREYCRACKAAGVKTVGSRASARR